MISLVEKVEVLERAEIADALRQAGWVKAKAARMLGITERMIGYKVKKYGIEKEVIQGEVGEGGASSNGNGEEKIEKEELKEEQ